MSERPEHPGRTRRCTRSAVRGLCAVACLVTWAAGCGEQPARRVVHVRVADQLYAAAAPLPGSTVFYPHRTLADQTRVVMRGRSADERMGLAPIAVEIDVPAGGVLEFGYGLGDVEPGTTVEFSVVAVTASGARELFRAELARRDAGAESFAAQWHDAQVDIGALSGRVELQFLAVSDRSATSPRADGVPPTGFFSEPVVTRPDRAPAPVNVVLISLDTLRADRLGIYGYGKQTSPNIDRIFGKEGVVVERLYSNAADTLNGHAAMLTGLLPRTALTASSAGKLAEWENTLAEAFRARGYRTGAFTEDAWVGESFRFWRGFERFAEQRGVGGIVDTPGYSHEIFSEGLQWLAAHGDQATFLFLHTYEVHYPYKPHGEIRPEDSSKRAVDSATYDGEIRYLDEQLGNFLTALEERGLSRSTIVVVTADHGEEFGEHGRRYHGTDLHDEVLHVPALFLAPGRLPAGARRPGPVAQVDLVPTILDLAGIAIPADLDGHSFAASLRDGTAVTARAMYHEARTELLLAYAPPDTPWLPPSYALTKWPYRLIRIRTPEGHRYELFDLVADPGETRNLYGALQQQFVAEREDLDRYEETSAARREALANKTAAAGSGADKAPSEEMDPRVKEKLRALGYAE